MQFPFALVGGINVNLPKRIGETSDLAALILGDAR